MIPKTWVIDASMGYDGSFCFCPYDEENGNVIIGLNYGGETTPHGERFVGVFHPDGNEAAETFYQIYKDKIDKLIEM